jgi:coronin-2
MLFRGIRSSKFKHVYGSPAKKEKCYDNIKITKNAHDSQFCAVNPKFVAIVTESAGGGCFIVIPIEDVGRLDFDFGRVTGHRGPVLDIKWNPFNDNIIASASDDCTIKIWQIPDEGPGRRGIHDSIITLSEHKRRVGLMEWHPSAENILVSAGFDLSIIVWHVVRGEAINIINCHPDTIQSISLNRDGSYVATTCKDKKLRIIDLRRGDVLNYGTCHEGSKSSKVVYLGDSGRLFTTGFSRFSDRQWAVWTQQDLRIPLRLENIDSSSGVLFPFYDHDTGMVYVAGKGDGSIRYYELSQSHPFCFYINQFMTEHPQRGLGIMPKRGLDPSICEVFRFYKLHAMRNLVEPVSMIVPRKSQVFQSDLYPDTAAPIPSMTAEEWLSGRNRLPVLMAMKSAPVVGKTHKTVITSKSASDILNQRRRIEGSDESTRHDINLTPLSSSVNNDRKFIFLSEEPVVDYRPKPLPRSDSQDIFARINGQCNNNNNQNSPRNTNGFHGLRRNRSSKFSGWPLPSDQRERGSNSHEGQYSSSGRVQKCYSAVNLNSMRHEDDDNSSSDNRESGSFSDLTTMSGGQMSPKHPLTKRHQFQSRDLQQINRETFNLRQQSPSPSVSRRPSNESLTSPIVLLQDAYREIARLQQVIHQRDAKIRDLESLLERVALPHSNH